MMNPEIELIAEVMLFAQGFEGSKILSKNITYLYKLAA